MNFYQYFGVKRLKKLKSFSKMNFTRVGQVFCLPLILTVAETRSAAQDTFNNSAVITSFLHDNFDDKNAGMVIGLVDEHGNRVFSAGKLDNGTDQEMNGDTIFEIGSITKTFTVLLLQDMVERGEMRLDDPVAKYLPRTVKFPSHGGKEITLENLAAQDSGLPFNADGLSGDDWLARYDGYTVQKMYAFLSGYTLTGDPGVKFQYSNIGMSLLGHVLELKTGASFESLVRDRICRPLKMDSTVISLSPSLNARAATGHDESGQRAAYYHLQVMAPAGALHSTANDLLKYLSANLGFTHSSLTPLMEKMQVIRHTGSPDMGNTAMPWFDQSAWNPPGSELLGHGGGTAGFATFIGFDKKKRRGVVVLSSQRSFHGFTVGWTILQGRPLTRESATHYAREIVGIGTALDLNPKTHALNITQVIPNSPAAAAGLSGGLTIQKIDGRSVEGKSLPECLALLQGKTGASVQLELVNTGRGETNTVELTRQKFVVN
jgi:CubicO group peptidase (beta-lactamase class C family)